MEELKKAMADKTIKSRDILLVPIKQISRLYNSRVKMDQEELHELMASMRYRGLFQPVGVKKLEENKYELLWGNRRVSAAEKLGWGHIECVLAEAKNEEDMITINLAENMHAKAPTFIDMGHAIERLSQLGLSTKEMSIRLAIDEKRLKRIQATYTLVPKEIRSRVTFSKPGAADKKGNIPESTARLVTILSDKHRLSTEKARQLYEYAGKKGATGLHVQKVAKLMKAGLGVKESIDRLSTTRVVNLTVVVDLDNSKRLERDHKMRIHEIIYEHLQSERWLKVVKETK